jgi:predicted DNA-binding protein (MmcQ/YjbR family)
VPAADADVEVFRSRPHPGGDAVHYGRMNVAQLKRFCGAFAGATRTLYGEPYNFLVYAVRGRKFAYFKTSEPERWRFSVRVAPDRFVELTDVPGVKPARYRGRYGWITIVRVEQFPATYLRELVEWSYARASSPRLRS